MLNDLLRVTSVLMIIYVASGAIHPASAVSQPSGRDVTHFCGVTHDQWNKQQSDQYANRHARTAAANLNVGEPYTVRVIYFLPNDRQPQSDIDTKLETIITHTQQSYAEVMEQQGFGKKTFRIETDDTGKVVVHHIKGRFGDTYYHTDIFSKVYREIDNRFDLSTNIYLVALDISNESVLCGVAGVGLGIIHASSGCFNVAVAAHELGHAFNLPHDRRRDANRTPTTYHADLIATTYCAAEWLDVHPYFNTSHNISNENTGIQQLDTHIPSSGESIRFRFRITDPDGLHQVQARFYDWELGTCKRLNGQSEVYEFKFSPTLYGPYKQFQLYVIDVHGNVTVWEYPIDNSLLHPRLNQPVSIPDANLAKAIREKLNLKPSDALTRLNLLNLTHLTAHRSQITDLTGLEYATQLQNLELSGNQISDINPVANLTRLHVIKFSRNQIADISPVANLNSLQYLYLSANQITDISPVANLKQLEQLNLTSNQIRDITPLANVRNLYKLWLSNNRISDVSPIANSRHLIGLDVSRNAIYDISDISALADLVNLTWLNLSNNSISDISSLAANTGLGRGDRVAMWGNPLNYPSIYTHIPLLQRRGITVTFNNRMPTPPLKISGDNQRGTPGAALEQSFVVEARDRTGIPFEGVPVTFAVTAGGGTLSITSTLTDANGRAESTLTLGSEASTNTVDVSVEGVFKKVNFTAHAGIAFELSVLPGITLIHVPLRVITADGIATTLTSISNLYDALGGAGVVNFLITYDPPTQEWRSFFVPSDKGTPGDAALADDTGIIAGLREPVSIRLRGNPLGTDGSSTITLNQGLNVVGLPLRDPTIERVSDLLTLEGISGNVPVIILTDGGEFKVVGRESDPGDIAITGGQAFIMNASRATTVDISGDAWANDPRTAAAPPLSFKGIKVGNTTPVLGLRGTILDDGIGFNVPNFRVTVKNLSTGRAVVTVTAADEADYRSTVVDIETGRAATVGDILEISAQSSDPFIGVKPLQYTVTAEDVKQCLIQLPNLIAYEIPAETQLLSNYPNPFNPETWMPYRLAEDAFVAVSIYDLSGRVVRTLDVGHRIAAVYENRSKAVYWDGRNNLGEQVASGVYFYQLSAGDFSATRKMLILK